MRNQLLCAALVAAAAGVSYAQTGTGAFQGAGIGQGNDTPIVFADQLPGTRNMGGTIVVGGSTPVGCENLVWDNGPKDNITAVVSQENIRNTPDSAAADDCFLQKGFIYRLDSFCGIMITNDCPPDDGGSWDNPDAVLNVYSDCDGCPDELLESYYDPSYEILGDAPFGAPGQFKFVLFTFDLNKLTVEGGERKWFSLVGIGDQEPGETYFWASANNGTVQGAIAKLRAPYIFGNNDWNEVGPNLNGPCTDLFMQLKGEKCSCLCDNTPKATDCGAKIINSTTFGSKSADNFQLAPCKSFDICKIEAYIATNCDVTRATLEVYGNDCDEPDSNPPFVFTNPWVFDTECTFLSPVSGAVLPVFRVCFEFDPGQFSLDGGRNYWLSVFVPGLGFITDEAYFLCKEKDDCHIKISQAKHIADLFGVKEWRDISDALGEPRDLAFRVLGTDFQDSHQDATAPAAVNADPADVNNDGSIDMNDLIRVLNSFGTN